MIKKLFILIIFYFLFYNNIYSFEEKIFENKFNNNYQIIGCYKDGLISNVNKNGNCLKGKGYSNILLPPKWHIDYFLKVYGNDIEKIITQFPIINTESGFNQLAQNNHAIGYVQTLRKWGIGLGIDEQLTWMKNRMDTQSTNKKQCGLYTGDNLIKCLYRYHYHAQKGYGYANKHYKILNFYREYFKN